MMGRQAHPAGSWTGTIRDLLHPEIWHSQRKGFEGWVRQPINGLRLSGHQSHKEIMPLNGPVIGPWWLDKGRVYRPCEKLGLPAWHIYVSKVTSHISRTVFKSRQACRGHRTSCLHANPQITARQIHINAAANDSLASGGFPPQAPL